jgi:hypothetical protein
VMGAKFPSQPVTVLIGAFDGIKHDEFAPR